MNEIPHEDEPTRPAKGRLSARDSMMLMTVISAPDGRDIGKVGFSGGAENKPPGLAAHLPRFELVMAFAATSFR